MNDEGRDSVIRKARQPFPEPELGADAAICSVVHIPGDNEEVRMFVNAQVDQVLIRLEGSFVEPFRYGVIRLQQPLKWAVDVEVSGVYEAEGLHERQLSVETWG
jgi:hypothetical protein